MFLGVNKGEKSFLSFILLVHVGILYSGKFFLTTESWGTNAVVITRVLCTYKTVKLYMLVHFKVEPRKQLICYNSIQLELSEDLTIVPLEHYLPEKSVMKIFH